MLSQVYKAIRGGVQEVAVKVLLSKDEEQMLSFEKVDPPPLPCSDQQALRSPRCEPLIRPFCLHVRGKAPKRMRLLGWLRRRNVGDG